MPSLNAKKRKAPRHSMRRVAAHVVLLTLVCILLTGCPAAPPPPAPPAPTEDVTHVRLPPSALAPKLDPATQHLPSYTRMAPALQESIRHLSRKKRQKVAVVAGGEHITWGQLIHTNERLLKLLPEIDKDRSALLKHFRWLALPPGTLVTGYYEPLIEASLTPHPDYPYPIYKAPANLKSSVWPSRERIDFHGALKGYNLEIAWAKDLTDVFFLHIQGSGRVRLPDGSLRNINYAGSNGHKYFAVGRALIDQGYATKEEMSMQTIRRLFREHPDKVRGWMALNPKYIFFSVGEGVAGDPVGAMGRPLTPRVSAAVDRKSVPLGSILVLDTMLPGYQTPQPEPFRGVILAQDTGTMKMNHFDLFMGFGPQAAHQAGLMKGEGTAYLLLAKD